MLEPTQLRVAPGVFVTWGPDGPIISHVDRPFDAYAISTDLMRVVVQLGATPDVQETMDELAVDDQVRESVLAAVGTLADAGVLTDVPESRREPLRDSAEEAARRMSAYPDIERCDPDFVRAFEALTTSTLTSAPLAFGLQQAVRHLVAVGVPGAIVECGVWRGGSMALVARTLLQLAASDRELWLYDTFDWHWDAAGDKDGFALFGSLPEGELDTSGQPKHLRHGTSVSDVTARLGSTGYPLRNARLVTGLVQDTIPANVPDRIALLRLDTDLYESTRWELEHLYPLLSPGGVLIIDDYGKLDGSTRAVDEYFAEVANPPLLHRLDVQGRIGVKPQTAFPNAVHNHDPAEVPA